MSPDKTSSRPQGILIGALRQDLCLAFANTLCWRGREVPVETLHTLPDLLGWLETSANLDAGSLHRLTTWSHDNPKAAVGLLATATALREVLYGIFSAIAVGAPVLREEFTALQRGLAAAATRTRLASSASGYAWELASPRPSAVHLLSPVLWSAGDLMVGAAHNLVRRCANDACLWLFLDESKNATRRWCDMASCGNRAKAQRHYLKVKGAQS